MNAFDFAQTPLAPINMVTTPEPATSKATSPRTRLTRTTIHRLSLIADDRANLADRPV